MGLYKAVKKLLRSILRGIPMFSFLKIAKSRRESQRKTISGDFLKILIFMPIIPSATGFAVFRKSPVI
jgi:hypothetical protein